MGMSCILRVPLWPPLALHALVLPREDACMLYKCVQYGMINVRGGLLAAEPSKSLCPPWHRVVRALTTHDAVLPVHALTVGKRPARSYEADILGAERQSC